MTAERSRVWLGGTAAIAFGLAAWMLHHGRPVLTAPFACPNIFDAVAAIGARVAPAQPLGLWLIRANALLLVLAVALTIALVRVCCGAWLIASAVGIAIVAQPVLDPVLSPFEPAALLVATATFAALVALIRRDGRHVGDHWRWGPWLGLMTTALVIPRATAPLALIAFGLTFPIEQTRDARRRWIHAGLAAGSLVGTAIALKWLIPGLPSFIGAPGPGSCLVAPLTAGSATDWVRGLRAALTPFGPYAFGLVALGAFTCVTRLKTRIWPFLAYAILPGIGTVQAGGSLLGSVPTTLVAYWVCLAIGLGEIVRACRAGVGGRIAATLLVVLLPLFQVPIETSPVVRETFDLERLSLRDLKQILAILPDQSALVSEDATIAVLLRGLDGSWQRMGKTLRLAPRDQVGISAALDDSSTRVFALPWARSDLQWQDFKLVDAGLAGVSGMVEVKRGGLCGIVKQRWVELPELQRANALSIAPSGPDRAIILYLASGERPDPSPINWRPEGGSGFEHDVYAASVPSDHVHLDKDARDDGLPADSAVRTAPFVTRLKIWRAPTAPMVLGVHLGVLPSSVVAQVPAAAPARVSVCPAFPHAPDALRVKR